MKSFEQIHSATHILQDVKFSRVNVIIEILNNNETHILWQKRPVTRILEKSKTV